MGCDFLSSAASNAVGTLMVDYLVKPVERRLRYLFRLKKIIEELREQKKNLTREQTRVQGDVEEAKRHIETQVIEKYVEDWLTGAENVLKDVQSLEGRIEENKRCFRWCPNWSWRYQLSKKIEKKTLAIKKLVEGSKFDRLGHRAALPCIEFLKSKDLIASKSSTYAFNQIMEALKSEGVNMIGVWGMGGVGKTTLVTEVGYNVKDNQLFNRVIKVVVSQTPIIENIQNKLIAEFFEDLNKFEKMTKERKAAELWARLEKEEKVLIIVDDLWNKLNLLEIGIPVGENHKGCKIILTTRRRQVCEDMESQVTVSLGVLDEEEAWTLFKMKASLENASPDIIGVAKEVAKECGGLPIAIVTLARALRSRDLNGWELAHRKLGRSRLMDIERLPKEVDQNAYLCLEMSYKHLKREPTKRCFLLCALYPEDYSIDVEDLVRYAWALRLYQDAGSIKEVRSEVFEAIINLKDSCLLSEDDEKGYIKLHDLVRDVALWIASNEDNGLVTKPGVGPENESSKQKLEILLLDDNNSETPIDGFDFKGMPELKVLSLRREKYNYSLFSLNALKSLTNLRALHLERFYDLEDISALANLTKLEILCLHDSECEEPIDKLGELQYLKVLDIRECDFSSKISPELTRRLVEVEELYLLKRSDGDISTTILPELNSLSRLATLLLKVSSEGLPKDFVFPRLDRYNIAIGTSYQRYLDGDIGEAYEPDMGAISSTVLRISEGLPLNVISKLLWNVEFLGVSHIKEKDIKFLTETTVGNVAVATILQNLKGVRIAECENLQVIFKMKEAENQALLLSKLEELWLWMLPNLEYIWKMPAQHISLRSLEVVKICGCGNLKSLFSFSLARSLECLEELLIEFCFELKQIVEQSEGDEQEISSNMSPDKSLCFPKLRNLEINGCDSLEYIFPNFMAQEGLPQLQTLSLEDLSQLKRIFRSAKQREESSILLPQLQLLPSLTTLSLSHCPELTDATILSPERADLEDIQLPKLKVLFVNTKNLSLTRIRFHNLIPEVDQEGLKELTVLKVAYCNSLEYLVDTTKEHVPSSVFSNLVELSLSEMDGLKMLCNGQFPKGFLENLKKLRVSGCDQLQEVFQINEENQAELFSNLEHLEVSSLPELRTSAHYFILRSLKVVKISRCKKLKSVFSPSLIQNPLQLEELEIGDCGELETLFAELESDGETESNSYLHPLCLQKLKILRIYRCARLEYALPITLAQGLPQLEELVIDCHDHDKWSRTSNGHLHPQLKQVFSVAKQHDGVEHCIKLPCLQHLRLDSLTNLSSFGPENYFFKAPALKCLYVFACPQLMKFTIQQVNSGVHLQDFEECIGDAKLCNNQLRERSPNMMNFGQLFQPPSGGNFMSSLETVTLSDLNWLRCIFPIMLIRNLPKLTILDVMRCEKLEQIIVTDDTSASSSQGHEKEMLMFPQLSIMRLEGLPSLMSFSPVGYHLVFSSLSSLYIRACSRMITCFTVDSTKFVHAETKAPRLDGAIPSKRDIHWMRYSWNGDASLPPYVEEAEEI